MVNVYSMSIAVIALFSKGSYAKEPNSRLGNIFKLEDDSLIISTPRLIAASATSDEVVSTLIITVFGITFFNCEITSIILLF